MQRLYELELSVGTDPVVVLRVHGDSLEDAVWTARRAGTLGALWGAPYDDSLLLVRHVETTPYEWWAVHVVPRWRHGQLGFTVELDRFFQDPT